MEDALVEVPKVRLSARGAMISKRIPNETTISTFWALLEKHDPEKHILGRQIPPQC